MLSVAALLTGCAKEGEVQDTEKKQEDTVLTILVQQSGTNMSGTWEGESADRLYEETGIRLEFYSNGNGDEKRLKQYLAAGTLPDIIGFRDMEQADWQIWMNGKRNFPTCLRLPDMKRHCGITGKISAGRRKTCTSFLPQ